MIARLKAWLAVIGALVLAGIGLWWKGRNAGKQAAKDAQAQRIAHAHEVRNEVENETAQLPDAPPQRVADADPATAAGKLRDDGWMR